jgi:N-acetylglucosamine repressor
MDTGHGLNHDDLKRQNRSHVLNTILESVAICRRDIAGLTGLTSPTITNLTGELIDCGLVEEIGFAPGSSKGGATPVLLSLTSEGPFVIGLHLATHMLEAGVVNLRGQVVAKSATPMPADYQATTVLSAALELVTGLCREKGLDLKRDVLGIGFATTANFAEDGSIVWHRHQPLMGLPVRQRLKDLFGLPVLVGNSARAMALAEAWFGRGRSSRNYLFVLVHDVIDSAVVVNRSVVVGSRNFSCLIGHSAVDQADELCYCGQKGCLETVASDIALQRQAEQLVLSLGAVPAHVGRGEPLGKKAIAEAAARGYGQFAQLLAQRGMRLGKAIAGAVNVIDVEAVIVAISLAAPESEIETDALVRAYTANLRFPDGAPDISFSKLKRELPFVGPATLVIRRIFSPELVIVPSATGELVASLSSR